MRIGHYWPNMQENGGVPTYIRRIGAAVHAAGHEMYYMEDARDQPPGSDPLSMRVRVRDTHDLFAQAKRLELDILHLHCPIPYLPSDCVTTVRSLHGHAPYCPSGTRYLEWRDTPCNRRYSLAGCLWGHLVDHCGSPRPQNLLGHFQTTWHEQRILPRILVMTDSQFLKDQMIRDGYPERMIHVLRLPPPRLADVVPPPQDGIPRFVFLGRLEFQKGVHWLLRALQQVSLPVHVDIVGDGTRADTMRVLAIQLGVNERVTFHGWVGEGAAMQLLRSARALIHPAVWHEPGAIVAVEAMANARALIMSRVGGMPEVVPDEVNGFTVTPNDVGGLARSIERLAADWSLAKRMGEEGRKLVEERYTLERHLAALLALYQIALQSSGVETVARVAQRCAL